ncbi:hypothetical protein DFH06DRAFT_1137762 [Mycena polygramma]|nr:hypothetical protein DFH06DRAFT_1137762 [Mycena polygramma]
MAVGTNREKQKEARQSDPPALPELAVEYNRDKPVQQGRLDPTAQPQVTQRLSARRLDRKGLRSDPTAVMFPSSSEEAVSLARRRSEQTAVQRAVCGVPAGCMRFVGEAVRVITVGHHMVICRTSISETRETDGDRN